MTLREFNEKIGVDYIWFVSHGHPAGFNCHHDPDGDQEGDCNFDEDEFFDQFWDLEGTVKDGQWCWDGEGVINDWRNNSIYNLKAS